MHRNFWGPSESLYGMFDLWSFRGLEAVVSSGLGRGSLIYSNVLLRKDDRWFGDDGPEGYEPWPVTRADLEPHYDCVEAMIAPQRYPFEHKPYDATPKAVAFSGPGGVVYPCSSERPRSHKALSRARLPMISSPTGESVQRIATAR